MFLERLLKGFLLEVEIKNYTSRTIKSYKNNNLLFLNYFKTEFNLSEIEELNKNHIKKYVQYLTKRGHKPTYINSILKTIRTFLNYCMGEGYINSNPCLKVSWQKEGKVIINTFTNIEVHQMMKAYNFTNYLNARNRCILAIFFDTGVRNWELCCITNADIRPRSILIHGKGNKERVVPISPYLRKVMFRYENIKEMYLKNRIVKNDYYFISYRQKQLTDEATQRVVKIAGDKANVRKEIRVSPHTCRHYYAQAQLLNGLDCYSLSRLLGHGNLSITKRYLQSIKDEEILDLSIKSSPLMNL